MEILLKEQAGRGTALAQESGKRAGMMTYSVAGPELMIIDHTEVEPAFNGKGIGKEMLYKIVEKARENNVKIIPLCPFAASVFKKSEDIKDVLKT